MNMDTLLKRADELIVPTESTSYLPIQNRIAYIVSEDEIPNSDHSVRTQTIAKSLNESGLETLCFVSSHQLRKLDDYNIGAFEKYTDGVRYIKTQLSNAKPKNDIDSFEQSVDALVEYLKVFRPKAIVATSNYKIGLAGYVAAKQLDIPFYHEVRNLKEDTQSAPEQMQEVEREVFVAKRAQHVFTPYQKIKEGLVQRGVAADSVELIPNGPYQRLEPAAPVLLNLLVGSKVNRLKLTDKLNIDAKTFTLTGNDKKELAVIEILSPGSILEFSAAIVYRLNSAHTTRKAVLLFDFVDKSGNRVESMPGIGIASAFKQHFRYLNANSKTVDSDMSEVFKFKLPDHIARVKVAIGTLGLSGEEHVDICIKGHCYNEEAEKERKRRLLVRQTLPKAIINDAITKRYTSDLTVACILDEFTAECLSHEVNLIKVMQETWQSQLEQRFPDFLLVESCWKGNDGNWGTITKGSGGAKKLGGLLQYCNKNGIPTVFWNKEDPPHYEKFGPIAKLFDLAITTDANMVPRYKDDFGIEVHPLSFGAQPKVHNPQRIIPRSDRAVFAGSYYGDKPKRCNDFNEVMRELDLAKVKYDIFDRNFGLDLKKFAFPDQYQDNIVGTLSPEDVWKAHKGYKYQVNMNSVQDSSTMFARRVYESLASGTPVISNDSLGVSELFGDIVIMTNGQTTIADKLKALETSPSAYNELTKRGVRAVMREHTYGHRLQALCRLLGINVEISTPKITLAVDASSEADIQRAKNMFDTQTAKNKHLFITLDNFDTAYKFLNESTDSVTFAMKLARDFYDDEVKLYGNDRVLRHKVSSDLYAEALEDFLYWGETKP